MLFDSASETNLVTYEEYDDYTQKCLICRESYSLVNNLEHKCPTCGRTPEEQSEYLDYLDVMEYTNSIDWETYDNDR